MIIFQSIENFCGFTYFFMLAAGVVILMALGIVEGYQEMKKYTEEEQRLIDGVEFAMDNRLDIDQGDIEEYHKLTDGTETEFGILENDINGAICRIESINEMVKSISEEIREMVDTISGLSATGEENSAATEETMARMEELGTIITQIDEKAKDVNNSADSLINEVSIFKVE